MTNRQLISERGNSSDHRDMMTFRLDQRPYALPIEPVVQIIPMVTITPVPKIDNLVEGAINVRGEAVPVVNLRRHLGLPRAPLQLHTPIVLVHVGEHTFGLIVDEVTDVLSFPPDRIIHPKDILPQNLHDAPILRGLTYVPEGMMLMLDPDHLFAPDQARAIIRALEFLDQLDSSDQEAAQATESLEEAESLGENSAETAMEALFSDVDEAPAGAQTKKSAKKAKE